MDEGADPAIAARIDYESPDKGRPDEFPAVWRVAWWAGLLWAVGTVATFYSTAWEMLSGQGASDSLTSRPYGTLYAVVITGLFLVAALLLAVLILPVSRRTVAWVAAIASAVVVVQVNCAILLSNGVSGAGLWSTMSLFAVMVQLLMSGGILLLAAVAWWPQWATARHLALAVALLILGYPLGAVGETLYSFYRGHTMGEVLREAVSEQSLPWNLRAGLMMLAAVMLIATAGVARRKRWPFVAAAVMVLVAIVGEDVWETASSFDYYRDNEGLVYWGRVIIGQSLMDAAALALFAWRPPDAASAGAKLARAE